MSARHHGLAVLVMSALLAASLTGCTSANPPDLPSDAATAATTPPATVFSYSQGIDANGFLEGIRALDFFGDLQYDGVVIPADVLGITDEVVQSEVDSVMSKYATTTPITDRPIQDGDTVNIDYVGSVDGVEFQGGTTGGAGTDVVIGQTEYVGDFIEQIKGHNIGDFFAITVTFPEDYGQDHLNGKDAVFAITINAIAVITVPELTDTFVAQNLATEYGWTTVTEMYDAIRASLASDAALTYVRSYLTGQVPAKTIPQALIDYQEQAMLVYYQDQANSYGMTLEDYIFQSTGLMSVDELLVEAQADLLDGAIFPLAAQAVAEDASLTVTEKDLRDYFLSMTGSSDYSTYAEQTGLPYVKHIVLLNKVVAFVLDRAVIE